MSEPSLNDMTDYNELKGEKRKTITIVIVAGLLMGLIYVTVDHFFGNVEDNLNVTDSVKTVPYK